MWRGLKKSRAYCSAAIATVYAVFGTAALAQTPYPAIIPPGGTPIPQLAPSSHPTVGPDLASPGQVRPVDVAGQVAIKRVRFSGVTVLSAAELEATPGMLTGPAVTIADIERARATIVTKYRERGFVFVTADATVEADGTLHFRIVEGFVSEVRLDGDVGPAGAQVLRFLNRLLNVGPLNVATMERQLLLAQDIPGLTVRTVLRPAGSAPGALSLIAQVSRRTVTGYLAADNRASPYSGPEQGLAAVQFNSFTTLAEQTEIALFHGRGSTQAFGQASWRGFIDDSGLQARLYAGHGANNPSGALRSLGYEGTSTVAGGSLIYPLIRQRSQTLNLVGAFDVSKSDIWVKGADESRLRLSQDNQGIIRAGVDWTIFDVLAGETRPATNFLNMRISQGVSGSLGDHPSRIGAEGNFTKIGWEASRTQTLFAPWPGAVFAVQGTVAGQWTDDILPLSEKFYLGGNRLGRGFYAGEMTGDRAVAVSGELQLTTSHQFNGFNLGLRLVPTYYIFADAGWTFENLAVDPNQRLHSFGLGVRMQVNERFEVQLEAARRFADQTQSLAAQSSQQDRFFWRVLARF